MIVKFPRLLAALAAAVLLPASVPADDAAAPAKPAAAQPAAAASAPTPETLKGEWTVDVARTVAARRAAKLVTDDEAADMQKHPEGLRAVFRFDGDEETFAADGGGWSRAYTAEAKDGGLFIRTRAIGTDETEAAKAVLLAEDTLSLEQDRTLFVLQKAAEKKAPAKPAAPKPAKPLAVKKLTPDGIKGTWEVDTEQSIRASVEKLREDVLMGEEQIAYLEGMLRSAPPVGLPQLTFDGVAITMQKGDNSFKMGYTVKEDGDSLIVAMQDQAGKPFGQAIKTSLLEDGMLYMQDVKDKKGVRPNDKKRVCPLASVIVLRKTADLPK
jgi:hypothetical protein